MLGKVFITRPIFDETVEELRKAVNVELNSEDRVLAKPELIEHLRDADAAITLVTDTVDREVLEKAPRLKVIANFGVGYNNVDVQTASKLGVIVTNTPGVLTETTADLAWSLLMSAARRIPEGDRFVRDGRFKLWGPKLMLGRDIFGKTLGIVGFGRIGQAVARRAAGFGMKVLFYDAQPIPDSIRHALGAEAVALEEIYRRSDFITLHVPLLAETTHLLNDRAFSSMKRGCIVVNTSRGVVIEEKALVRALQTGMIAGAALDVYEHEPEIEPELLKMDNVVLAPHVGSASYETRLKMSTMTADNVMAVLCRLKPPNIVNPEVWDRRRQ